MRDREKIGYPFFTFCGLGADNNRRSEKSCLRVRSLVEEKRKKMLVRKSDLKDSKKNNGEKRKE